MPKNMAMATAVKAYGYRYPTPIEKAGEHIPAQVIRPEDMTWGTKRQKAVSHIDNIWVIAG